jgi:membrane protein required for colicin V production
VTGTLPVAALIISILNFTLLDWLILAILVYCTAVSAYKGFIREGLGLATVLLAALIASWSSRGVAGLFKDVVRTENLALFLGFSIIFLAIVIAGFVAIWLITRFMKFAKLEWADRLLGAAFGLIRGWVIGAVLLLVLTAFEVQTERVRNSELAPLFLPGSRLLAAMTPYELKAKFLVGYRATERWWREQQ